MAGAAFTGDFEKLRKLVDGMGKLASKKFITECNRQLANEAVNQVQQSFASGVDPYGKPWRALLYRDGQPLRKTGRLLNSFRGRVVSGGFMVESNVVYAAIQNYGGTVQRYARSELQKYSGGKKRRRLKANTKARNVVTHVANHGESSTTIPARQYLPSGTLGPRWRGAFVDILTTMRERALGK